MPDDEFQTRLAAAIDEETIIPVAVPSPEKLRKLGVVFDNEEVKKDSSSSSSSSNLDSKYSAAIVNTTSPQFNDDVKNQLERSRVIENVADIIANVAKSFVNRPEYLESRNVRNAVKNVIRKIYNSPKYYNNISQININEVIGEFKDSSDFFQPKAGTLPGPFHNRYGTGVDQDIDKIVSNLIPTFTTHYEEFVKQNVGKPGGLAFSK
jgi:hypothetical protein